MRIFFLTTFTAMLLLVFGNVFATPNKEVAMTNPLLNPWSGPYGGLPPFDKVDGKLLKPAMEAAMAEQLAAIEAIAKDPAPPTFDNTLAVLEKANRRFELVGSLYDIWSSNLSTPEFQAIERELEPKLAAHKDRIKQNEKIFKRIDTIYKNRDNLCKTPEQKRLAWLYHKNYVRAGAKLNAADKKRVATINQRLATLFTQFTQNVLAEENSNTLVLEKESDLAGLPDSMKAAAAAAAEKSGQKGKWAIINTRSSIEPFLSYAERRDLREKVWRTFISRGELAKKHDNKKLITEILQLRAERAHLLGYKTHAHWRVEDSMAKTPEKAMELMMAVWPAALARVKADVAEMQALADKEKERITIAPWDYRYYTEKVRKAKYDIDASEIRPYLQMEKLREGMFWVAGKLFDLHFKPAKNVAVFHPDVRVWEVRTGDKKLAGLLYFDPWARPEKKSGAWSSDYRSQERFEKEIATIVSVNTNFVQGKPALISWDDAETLFHEFGHALHGLCSSVNYPSLSGSNVVRDFVELPSQLLENWLSTPEVLNKFAVHYKTGKPIPKKLVEKIKRSAKFNQGFATVEYLASALMDMKAHLAGDKKIVPTTFERQTLKVLGMPREIVMRHRLPQFNHIFADDSYSAGYYSYLWADMLNADAYEAFTEARGPYDHTIAKKLYDHIFSVGNTVDPAETYRAFRGRDASFNALMRKRGFPDPSASASTPVPAKAN